MNHQEIIVKNGTVRIPSIFMFEDWIDIEPFIRHARKMNCTVIFENENLTVEPNNYEKVRRQISFFTTMVSERKLGDAYVRYIGNPDKMRWENVK